MEKNLEITVREAPYHGGAIIYQGRSINQAIRAAKKNSCHCGGGCGGVQITASDEINTYRLQGWWATRPFFTANKIEWDVIDRIN